MARILCAWELGANLGHLGMLLVLGRALRDRGHDVIFAVRNLAAAESVLGSAGFRLLQAPIHMRGRGEPPVPPASYAGILEHAGYGDTGHLLALAKAWREIFRLTDPQAIVFDHAPVALLAARSAGVPRFVCGDGFSVPPRAALFPNMRPWLPATDGALAQTEAPLLDAANWVLETLGTASMERLGEIFDVEGTALCTFRELDHYPGRDAADYAGPLYAWDHGDQPAWPEAQAKRVFVYLRPECAALGMLLDALGTLPHCCLCIVPGAAPELTRRYESPRIWVSAEPIRLADLGSGCDLALTYAGHGTTAALLLAGVPLVLFPQHLEQYLVARNVAALGAGVIIEHAEPGRNYAALINAMLDDAHPAHEALNFAKRHGDFEPAAQAGRIADRVAQLI